MKEEIKQRREGDGPPPRSRDQTDPQTSSLHIFLDFCVTFLQSVEINNLSIYLSENHAKVLPFLVASSTVASLQKGLQSHSHGALLQIAQSQLGCQSWRSPQQFGPTFSRAKQTLVRKGGSVGARWYHPCYCKSQNLRCGELLMISELGRSATR